MKKGRRLYTHYEYDSDPLIDEDKEELINKLTETKRKDFPLKKEFDEIKTYLTEIDKNRLKIVKLLYWVGFKRESMVHLGVILESGLNSIVREYQKNDWQTPERYTDKDKRDQAFSDFITGQTLRQKGGTIVSLNLINNKEASELLRSEIESLGILRNYGGHDKTLSVFIEEIMKDGIDQELRKAFEIIKKIKHAKTALNANPPKKVNM